MHQHPTGVQFRTDIDPPVTVPATPVVRARAEGLGIDVDTVPGSGVAGRVRLADLAAPSAVPGPADRSEDRAIGRAGSGNGGLGAVVVEVDVTRWIAVPESESDLRAHVVSSALETAAGRITEAAVAVADAAGVLRSVEVPHATELSVGGLARAMAAAEQRELPSLSARAPTSAKNGPALTVVEAMAGATFELPVVTPASAVTVSVGASEVRVVPTRAGGERAIALRDIAPVTIAWDPAVVTRSLIADMVTALR